MKDVFLSVVVPCYDEMANLQKGVLDKVIHFLEKQKYSYELIVVDDGSTDGSVEFIQDFAKENSHVVVLSENHKGKAGAVTFGMLKAVGKYILFTDMDQATPIEEIKKLLPYFDQEYDIVIGSRNTVRRGAPWTRRVMARGMIILRKFIVGLNDIADTQCGFKMFKKETARDLFTSLSKIHNGFGKLSGSNVAAGFDVELLYLAEKKRYKIKEVPVRWLYVETRRVNPVTDSIEGLRGLLAIRMRASKHQYIT